MPFLPPHTHRDAGVLLTTRGIRGFVDGLVSLAITALLPLFGFSALKVGIVVTGMMLGSAALTLLVGTRGHGLPRRSLLVAGSVLMVISGALFGTATSFAALLVVGVIGTMNPTSGDVSVFLPLEQSMLAGTTPAVSRTALYARYTFIGGIAGAFGTLAIRIPEAIARNTSVSEQTALRWCFGVYVLAGLVVMLLYRTLSVASSGPDTVVAEPLGRSRTIVYKLAALFSLDAFGGGFVVQSMLALWLFQRFDLSIGAAGTLLFVTGTLSAASGFVAAWLAKRIGLVRTMVFSHLPANCFLIAAAFMPNVQLAVVMLILRSLLSSMDVPARTSYVMAVVSPAERAAAASVTNVPRSLAAALPPTAAGWMLDHSTFGWPLIIAGSAKIIYDLLLLRQFRHLRPEEEQQGHPAR
ncbi:MAG TPA: MFS transporter [Ilumatobacteraceae bacterium]|nr:MFS transporter [Ilumatobacteraceae bacterium]HRB03550.1 MFS transporter [Ilumatobacteraceae bacterium]